MLAREEEVDVEVRWEDQERINEFGRNNNRLSELRQDKAQIKDLIAKLDDATTELMTGEGDSVKLMLGDCFIHCSEEYATEHCEKKQEAQEGRVESFSAEEKQLEKRQKDLKKKLYERFGSSIQLEA